MRSYHIRFEFPDVHGEWMVSYHHTMTARGSEEIDNELEGSQKSDGISQWSGKIGLSGRGFRRRQHSLLTVLRG